MVRDWLTLHYQQEATLWSRYRQAWYRQERASRNYCEQRSWSLWLFWLVLVIAELVMYILAFRDDPGFRYWLLYF